MSGIIGDNTSESSGSIATVSGVTTSGSDPAVDTNPSGGVGTMFVNSTSGEMFICTDSTTGENVWTNVGDGEDGIEPWSYGGTLHGYTGYGAEYPYFDRIDRFSFASGSEDATDVGNGINNRAYVAGNSSLTYGYTSGGLGTPGAYEDYVDKFQFAATADAADIGDLPVDTSNMTGVSDTNNMIGYGVAGNARTTTITKITYSSDAISTSSATLYTTGNTGSGTTSATHGYVGGGGPAPYTEITKFIYSSETNGTLVGSLGEDMYPAAGASSETHGYTFGNSNGGYTDSILKHSFSSDGDATDADDLTVAKAYQAGQSSKTYAYSSGGKIPGVTNVIERWPFASDGGGVDVGNLTVARGACAGYEQ